MPENQEIEEYKSEIFGFLVIAEKGYGENKGRRYIHLKPLTTEEFEDAGGSLELNEDETIIGILPALKKIIQIHDGERHTLRYEGIEGWLGA